jgi:hypothetical protein
MLFALPKKRSPRSRRFLGLFPKRKISLCVSDATAADRSDFFVSVKRGWHLIWSPTPQLTQPIGLSANYVSAWNAVASEHLR